MEFQIKSGVKERYFGSKIVNKFRQTKEKIFKKYKSMSKEEKIRLHIGIIGVVSSIILQQKIMKGDQLMRAAIYNDTGHQVYF